MDFRIAYTFTDITGDEQKAVKTTAFDLQMKPVSPGMSFYKLEGKDVRLQLADRMIAQGDAKDGH